MKGVIPPLTNAQESALLFVEAKDEAKRMNERANDRKEDMVRAAAKAGIDVIKIHDAKGRLHVFDFSNEVRVKQSVVVDIKIEKQEPEAVGAN